MTEFEPDMTNLLIQMRINNIMKSTTNRDEGIIPKPKVIKTETTQKMINEYKEAQNQPLEIGGKKYAYHPAVAVVNLDKPAVQNLPFDMQRLLDYEEDGKNRLIAIDDRVELIKEQNITDQKTYNIEMETIDEKASLVNEERVEVSLQLDDLKTIINDPSTSTKELASA